VSTAAEFALEKVRQVRDDPDARLALMRRLYAGPDGDATAHLPYRCAAVAFMRWQLRRGLLRPLHGPRSGSPWWRAVNERLLRDGWEALAVAVGYDPAGATASVSPSVEFIREPTARNWYRAHNASIVAAYLEHRDQAEQESRTERFFINLVLMRVLYAHTLVSAPRLALGWLGPVAPALGDPRVRMTGIFLRGDRAPVGPTPRRRRHPAPPAAGLRLVGRRAWPARRARPAGRRRAVLCVARGRPTAVVPAPHRPRADGTARGASGLGPASPPPSPGRHRLLSHDDPMSSLCG